MTIRTRKFLGAIALLVLAAMWLFELHRFAVL